MEAMQNDIVIVILCLIVLVTIIAFMLKAGHYCYKCGKPVPGKWYDREYTCPYCGSKTKKTLVDRNIFVRGRKPISHGPINARPEYALNFFSTNPEIVESDSEYVVKTGFWRSPFRLFTGFRKLTIWPNSGELSLSVTNYWIFTHSVVIPFDRIDHIHPWVITNEYGIKLVLKDTQEEIDLFSWAQCFWGVGEDTTPFPPAVLFPIGDKKAAYKAVLNRLQQITGAKIQYEEEKIDVRADRAQD